MVVNIFKNIEANITIVERKQLLEQGAIAVVAILMVVAYCLR